MAYVNGTTHYNLPQTVGTDKRDWADTNQAFSDLDAAVYSAVEDVADAQTEINGLKERMTTAEGNITTNANDISALDGRLTTAEGTITQHTSDIADVRSDCEDMICAYNEATATSTHAYAVGDYFIYNDVLYRAIQVIAIGDTIVPDTNCTTTNVATEIRILQPFILSTVVSDGVKTFAQLFNELMTNYNSYALKESRPYMLERILPDDSHSYYKSATASNTRLTFNDVSTDVSTGEVYSAMLVLDHTLANCKFVAVRMPLTGDNVLSDNSSVVPAADNTFILYC